MTLGQVKTMQDVKKFLQQYVERKTAVERCVREGRPLSELESQGIKVAKLSEVLNQLVENNTDMLYSLIRINESSPYRVGQYDECVHFETDLCIGYKMTFVD